MLKYFIYFAKFVHFGQLFLNIKLRNEFPKECEQRKRKLKSFYF